MKRCRRCYIAMMCWCLILLLTACGPSLTQEEEDRLDFGNTPVPEDTEFQDALHVLGRLIGTGGESPNIFLVEIIHNITEKKDIPSEVTDMVITSVNHIARFAEEYVLQAFSLVEGREYPQLIITGSVTEFDQNISVKQEGIDLNFFLSPEIENEVIDIDLNAEFDKTETASRIAIDFHLVDSKTGYYVPSVNCNNSILVYELEKNRQWRFVIYGSGVTKWGKIKIKQGTHEAVRKLVDYSMMQLFGTYYNLPYWRMMGMETPEQGRKVLSAWRHRFSKKKPVDQILTIQKLLLKYSLGQVLGQQGLVNQDELYTVAGNFEKVTQGFILKFLYMHVPDSPLITFFEKKSFEDRESLFESLWDLYITLLQNLPVS